VDSSPPPEDGSAQFQNVPLTSPQDVASPDAHPQSIPPPQKPRRASRYLRRQFALVFLLNMSLITIVSALILVPALKILSVAPTPTPARRAAATSTPTPTPTFDPSLGAVLPTHRVVAYYAVPYAEPTGP
jgi:hypothetical protein